MADIEQQARELLAAEYAMAGSTKRADKIIAGFDCSPGTEYAIRAISAALRTPTTLSTAKPPRDLRTKVPGVAEIREDV